MEALLHEHEKLEKNGNLGKSLDNIQDIIDQLKATRESISASKVLPKPAKPAQLPPGLQLIIDMPDPGTTLLPLAKLQNNIKSSFDKANDSLKEIHSGLTKYGKVLDKKFKDQKPPSADNDALSSQQHLINRAIAMHLLREGHFGVATTFINEVNAHPPPVAALNNGAHGDTSRKSDEAWDSDFSPNAFQSTALQARFAEMYHILAELRSNQNLAPAIEWARTHSEVLEARGSNLEFDLCRLQFASLFMSDPVRGPLTAHTYALQTFTRFPQRYFSQTQALLGALAFAPNIATSPYASLFSASPENNVVNSAAAAFTSEFCALMSLSSASPLLTAVTAGCIALPTLLKLSQIQQRHHTSWTTASELPVEIPLPPQYHFHSVFVCPVSKEQSTDENPPMMMPCGHVVAKDSLEKLSKGGKFKCPYCPSESTPNQAIKVYL